MKKVLIFYASFGGGHLSAANSIKEHITSNYPDINVDLIDCMKYINGTIEKVTTTAYQQITKNAPWAWGQVYNKSQSGALAHISSSSNKIMAIKLKKLIEDEKPELIISTHPFSNQMCSYLKKKEKIAAKIATVLTDYAPHEQWLVGKEFIDYFFVAHNGMKKALHDEGIPNEKIFATGIPISNKFLIHYNKSELLEQFDLTPNKKTVLFFAGGEFGLSKNNTLDIFKILISDFYENIQIIAISGKNLKMKSKFEEIVKEYNREQNVRIIGYTNEVPKLMKTSDLVISKPGGLTSTESIASGLPIIVINPIPGQEESNAEYLENAGVAIWLRKNMDTKETLASILSNPDKMKEMKIRARILAKKHSTMNICKILLG